MKSKRKGIIARIIPGAGAHWEIFAVHNKRLKKAVRFRSVNGTMYEGFFEFATRLISHNGNEIAINPRQFNTIAGAKKNINSVKNSA